jgi:hypothetical protein
MINRHEKRLLSFARKKNNDEITAIPKKMPKNISPKGRSKEMIVRADIWARTMISFGKKRTDALFGVQGYPLPHRPLEKWSVSAPLYALLPRDLTSPGKSRKIVPEARKGESNKMIFCAAVWALKIHFVPFGKTETRNAR